MKILLSCALSAAVMVATAPSIAVARPGDPQNGPGHTTREAEKKPPRKANPAQEAPYGQWHKAWGAQPPAPPKHWTKKGDWYRHVRVCQQKYRSYNARTDTYRMSAGKTRRCTL